MAYYDNADLDDLALTFMQRKTAENVIDIHGSGIDADWTATLQKNGKLVLHNSYHAMNEWGSYVVWIDFNVKVGEPGKIDAITLSTNSAGRYWADRLDLVNYLWDTF